MRLKKLLGSLLSAAMVISCFSGVNSIAPDTVMKASAAGESWKFDLGGNGAASGFTGVSASDGYSASKGYGFAQTANVANVAAAGSGALNDAVQFKSTSEANTFNVDLPKGLYEIKVTTGNTTRTSIKAEGMLQLINLTGNNAVETFQIPVTDGQLNIQATEGKANTPFSLSAIEIKRLNDTGTTNPTVWICGDSTVANYYNTSDTAQHGWGQFFGDYVSPKGYIVRNMAASGQYAKGFVDAGQFKPIETYGKAGDYYIISIGINDTNYSNATEYYNTVTDMVKKSKAKGMEVILVKQQGRRGDLNRTPLLTGRWFGGELDKIGAEQSVQVVDLFTQWQQFGVSVGYDGMAEYYAIQANGSNDDLHQSMKGSKKLAELMAGLVSIGKEPSEMDTSKPYMLKNVNSGLYLEVAGAKAEVGANVQQWGADSPADHNVWRLKHKGYNYYEIWSYLDGGSTYLLDVENGSAASGANISINKNTNTGAQWFRFFENDDGSYTLVSRCSGDNGALEITSALTTSGANAQQWEVNGHPCQHWQLEAVEYPPQTTTTTTTVTTTVATTTTTAPRLKKFPGDATNNDKIDIADVVLIMQYVANKDRFGLGQPEGITEQGLINADVIGDDGVTSKDSYYIQLYLVGIISLPPKEYYPPDDPVETDAPQTTEIIETTTSDPRYYAVDQTWVSGITETVNAGFTKTEANDKSANIGYLNLDNILDSSVTFNVDVPAKGNYMMHIRFANGTDADRKMKLYVNGNTTDYWMQSFTGTGAWTMWNEFGIVLPLAAGKNSIQFVSATDNGGPNLDYITLTPTDEPYAETYDPSSEKNPSGSDKPTIYIAGDSTVQSYRAQYAPQQGWGYYLQENFNENVTVANHSIAGRSTKKFYDEGRWQTIVDSLKPGDFVMIQFAINDAGTANKDRYAPICGNVNSPSDGSYEWYMTEFIKTAKEKGATPILVTTVIGMKAYSGGKFVNSYTNYCNACKQLSAKYNVPCIDLNTIMVNHYNSVGYNEANSYHLCGAVADSTDGTHFCEKGAKIVAGLVASAVKSQGIAGLANNVK